MNRILWRGARVALALIAILSCSENSLTGTNSFTSDDLSADAARIASIAVSLPTASIAVGDTVRATATLRDAQSRLINWSVFWSSSNPAVATVSPTGLVTGVSEGQVDIVAARGSARDSTTVVVGGVISAAAVTNPGTVNDLTVASTDSTGVTLSFTQVDDGTGQPAKYDVRYDVAPISWGTAPTATSGTCTTPVSGTAIGTTLTCSLLGLKPSTNYQFQLVPFRGTLNQNAVFGGLSNVAAGATTASTPPVAVASVSISPGTASVQVGSTIQLAAVTRDSSGNVLTGRSLVWSSSNPGAATVSASGLVTGAAAGTAQITATSEGKSGSAAVTVTAPQSGTPGKVTDLSVSAIDSTAVVLSFTQVNDGTGNPAKYDIRYSVAPISWGTATSTTTGTCKTPVVGTSIGSVLTCMVPGLRPSTNYNFQLVAFRGTLNQDAVFGFLSNVAAATTTSPPPVPVATVSVSPASATVQVGSSVQLSATTRDANNNVLTGRTVTWSSSNGSVATVSSAGRVAGVAAGSAQITATSEGKVGSATVTVTSPPPPPPPGSSNEPTGMTTLTDRPYNAMNELGWSDYWPGGLMSFVSDVSAPHSPNGILRATYPAGFGAGSGPGAWDPPPLGNKKTAYIAVWFRHSANWYGQDAGVNKMFYLHASTNDAPVFYFSATGVGTGDLTPQIRLQATVSPPESNLSPNLVPSARVVRGQWNLLEVVAVGNSAGNRDGSVDWYLNGVHIGSFTSIEWQSGGTTWQRLSFAPVWGGIGGSVPATQWLDFDHTYVSVK